MSLTSLSECNGSFVPSRNHPVPAGCRALGHSAITQYSRSLPAPHALSFSSAARSRLSAAHRGRPGNSTGALEEAGTGQELPEFGKVITNVDPTLAASALAPPGQARDAGLRPLLREGGAPASPERGLQEAGTQGWGLLVLGQSSPGGSPTATRPTPARGGGERALPPSPRPRPPPLPGPHPPAWVGAQCPAVQSGFEPPRGALRCRHRDPRPPKHPAPHPQLRPPGRSGAEARAGRRLGVCPQTGRGRTWRGGDWAGPHPRGGAARPNRPLLPPPRAIQGCRRCAVIPAQTCGILGTRPPRSKPRAGEAHLLVERGT